MQRVGIREMRQHLSQYASRVRTGESFVLTDRGEEIARLVPVAGRTTAVDRVVADRNARRGAGDLLAVLPPLDALSTGRPTSDVLDDLREERF